MSTDHKPKLTPEKKLSQAVAMCDRLKIKDVIVPASVILLDRFTAGKTPVGVLENKVFSTLAKWKELGKIDKLTPGIQGYVNMPAVFKEKLFHKTLLDWDLDKPLDNAALFGTAWIAEGLPQAKRVLYNDPPPSDGPGQCRPWMGELYDPDLLKKYLAPWPWINAVNKLRVRDHVRPLNAYDMNEYEAKCGYSNFNPDTNEVQVSFSVNNGQCSIPEHRAPDGNCLRVPEVRPGESVEIVGFNFFSKACRIRLQSTMPNGWKGEIPVSVHGDQATPVKDENGNVVADDRVVDRLMFQVPTNVPGGLYGDYRVTVVVPNDINYDFGGETVSNSAYENSEAEFLSNNAYLRVIPSGDQKYRTYLSMGTCYDQTDGEWFSDEIYVAGFPVIFHLDATEATHLPNSGATTWGDVDQNEKKVNWNWNPLGTFESSFNLKNSVLALGLVGYEVDSEDALKNQVKSFGSAYVEYLKLIWEGVVAGVGAAAGGISVSDALKALAAKIGVAWSLIITAIVLAALLAIGLIYASWAPADMIFKDVLIMTETDLFNLTQPNYPLPRPSTKTIRLDDDFSLTIKPVYTNNYVYREERRYQSREQGSDYGFTWCYERVT